MRGQLSLEYLLLFAIFLAALAILVSAALGTNNTAKSTVNGLLLQKTVLDISNTVDDICVLGEGNVRQIHVSLIGTATLSASGKELVIRFGNASFSKTVQCALWDSTLLVNDTVLSIRSNGSKISISLP